MSRELFRQLRYAITWSLHQDWQEIQSGGAKQLISSKHWRQIPAHHWQDRIRRNLQFSQYHFLLKCYFKMCASWNRWNRNTHKRAITDLNDLLEVQWVMNEPNPSVHIEINMRLLRESGQNTILNFNPSKVIQNLLMQHKNWLLSMVQIKDASKRINGDELWSDKFHADVFGCPMHQIKVSTI